eukprot:gene4286-6073_t
MLNIPVANTYKITLTVNPGVYHLSTNQMPITNRKFEEIPDITRFSHSHCYKPLFALTNPHVELSENSDNYGMNSNEDSLTDESTENKAEIPITDVTIDQNASKATSRSVENSSKSSTGSTSSIPPMDWSAVTHNSRVPSPLRFIVDFNMDRRSVVYEVTIGRDIGFEIIQGFDLPIVGEVFKNSKACELGILTGDTIIATSATAGDQMWAHDSAESVKSALHTRFVMSPNVKIKLERKLSSIPDDVVDYLKIPYYTTVKLKRPLGLHVVEGPGQSVYVQYVKPNFGAAKSKRVEVGDQIVAMSASWGDRLWEVNSVESFVVGVKMRSDPQLTFKFKRLIPLSVFIGHSFKSNNNNMLNMTADQSNQMKNKIWAAEVTPDVSNNRNKKDNSNKKLDISTSSESRITYEDFYGYSAVTIIPRIERISNKQQLEDLINEFNKFRSNIASSGNEQVAVNSYVVNKIMNIALELESPAVAVKLFEEVYNYSLVQSNTADSILKLFGPEVETKLQIDWKDVAKKFQNQTIVPVGSPPLATFRNGNSLSLKPNNFVCTTAVKAYGRTRELDKALGLLEWMESFGEIADIYLMSALVYVCAKSKKTSWAEKLFWHEIPKRNLSYTTATANSLMYMYAKQNRPDDALKIYELIKSLGLQCSEVTYGVLIKALMRSGKKQLQDIALEVLKSLPNLNINPGIEIYKQFLEYYAQTDNYKQTKSILRIMSKAKPKVHLDAVAYGYIIECFANSKKPRSTLAAYQQMTRNKIAPNGYAYMGVLKALVCMRDGFSAVQVIREMYEINVLPDKRHYSMAMFACVISNQPSLAESILALYLKQVGGKPDQVLCTLWLRAILQQGRWKDGMELFNRMKKGQELPQPNMQTYNCLLQFQIIGGKFKEASETLKLLLDRNSEKGKSFSSRSSLGMTLKDTFLSLSFALGEYSAAVTKIYREDIETTTFSPLLLTNPNANNNDSVAYNDDNIISNQSVFESSTPVTQGNLPKPSAVGLEFLVSSLELIGSYSNIHVKGEFYMELLKALVMEGQPQLAKKLLELRESSKFQLIGHDVAKMSNIENLASRAIGQGLILQK